MNRLSATSRFFFLSSPIHSEVRKGETIVLSCGASGFPDPTYEWYRDGGRLSSAHSRYKVRIAMVVIGWGEINVPHNVIVVQLTDNLFQNVNVIKVNYKNLNSNRSAIIGPKLHNSFYMIKIYDWNLKLFFNFQVEKNGTLIIENAQLDDTAHYRCSASNYLGRASSSARVKVNLALPDCKTKFK